jgi:hypothetical protein
VKLARLNRSVERTVLAALVASLVGCSGSNGPEVYPVTGTVTQGGQPVEGAVLAFIPADEGAGGAAAIGGQAQTGPDGKFEATGSANQGQTTLPGLPLGSYKVTVMKMVTPPGEASFDRPPKNVLPPEYAMVESTPVSLTVTAEGPNTVDVSL